MRNCIKSIRAKKYLDKYKNALSIPSYGKETTKPRTFKSINFTINLMNQM